MPFKKSVRESIHAIIYSVLPSDFPLHTERIEHNFHKTFRTFCNATMYINTHLANSFIVQSCGFYLSS